VNEEEKPAVSAGIAVNFLLTMHQITKLSQTFIR